MACGIGGRAFWIYFFFNVFGRYEHMIPSTCAQKPTVVQEISIIQIIVCM